MIWLARYIKRYSNFIERVTGRTVWTGNRQALAALPWAMGVEMASVVRDRRLVDDLHKIMAAIVC